ncbi:MAG TPA: hypothetical protein VFF73_41765 [Planctomycetota bacterium]|nr:hypothetical protein [Planctomycetota bacterium]
MIFTRTFSSALVALAFFACSSARAQDPNDDAKAITARPGPLRPPYRAVTPLYEMEGWVKVHKNADTGRKDASGKPIKADLVFFTSTERPSSVFTPNIAETNPEERREEAARNVETYQVVNEPFKTLLDSKLTRTDPLFIAGSVESGTAAVDSSNYRTDLKTIRVTSIKVKNASKNALDIYSTPDATSQKWSLSILPDTMVTITNVVGSASSPTFYQIAIPTTGAPLVGYVKCSDLPVGHSADLLERLGRLFTIGIKTAVVGPRNAGLETADRAVDTADKVEDTAEGAGQWLFDEGGNVVRATKDVGAGIGDSFKSGDFGTDMSKAADKAGTEFSKTPGLVEAVKKANEQ